MKSIELYGIRLDSIENVELDALLKNWLIGSESKKIFTPNPEFILIAKKDDEFKDILNSSDLLIPDGIGLTFAAAALKDQKIIRHTGTDTLVRLVRLSAQNQKKILLLGGENGVEQKAMGKLKKQFPNLEIEAIDPGFVDKFDVLVDIINKFKPDVLAVALGQKKQEIAIHQIIDKIPSVKIAIGVGGALDMISGALPRAPKLMRTLGLEWLWRLYLEPSRWKRIYRAVIIFPFTVACDTLKQRRFFKACRAVIKELVRICPAEKIPKI